MLYKSIAALVLLTAGTLHAQSWQFPLTPTNNHQMLWQGNSCQSQPEVVNYIFESGDVLQSSAPAVVFKFTQTLPLIKDPKPGGYPWTVASWGQFDTALFVCKKRVGNNVLGCIDFSDNSGQPALEQVEIPGALGQYYLILTNYYSPAGINTCNTYGVYAWR